MKPDLKNRNVVVLGAGRSGLAAARFLLSQGARVMIQDEAAITGVEDLVNEGCRIQSGEQIAPDENFDLAIISPGIDPRKEWVRSLQSKKIPLWSELELAWQFCQCPVVAITGTNGKTTTTELIESAFIASGKKTVASGNIGLPLTEAIRGSASLDVMVVEVSSFQLEQIKGFRPATSVFLNLTADHLDRYDAMEDYAAAKYRIFENQTPEDCAVVNADYSYPAMSARQVTFSTTRKNARYGLQGTMILKEGHELFDMQQGKLRGVHNAENIMAALAVAEEWSLPLEKVAGAICAYEPAPHRCEVVGCFGGVTYINDSKATNPDALAKALLSQPGRVILIAGGKDKGFSFESLAVLAGQKIQKAFLIGETAEKISSDWKGHLETEVAGDLERAFHGAVAHAKTGDVILFSPACSSFDQFKNYQDRGERFKNFVFALGHGEAKTKQHDLVKTGAIRR